MKRLYHISFLGILLVLNSCITEFIPNIEEKQELLVVQGLITDQPVSGTIKLSRSLALGEKSEKKPLGGCTVSITDNHGSRITLTETSTGVYVTPPSFHGVVGNTYSLHILTNSGDIKLNYETDPIEMKPVPPIDSIYYEKKVIEEPYENFSGVDACQIYLDAYDPTKTCKYYRWDYEETWILRLLFPVENMICWISDISRSINVKSTEALKDARIYRYPINYISNETDRLKRRYSILINQYSISEDEYIYWEKLQRISVKVGGLYDIIPSSVPGNIRCIENPSEKVLGYFSVSAKTSKRIFIDNNFTGIIDRYNKCISDSLWGDTDPPDLGISKWTLIDHPATWGTPRFRIFTIDKGCADCTVRGSNVRPDFWKDAK
jgi:hypothetical protein